MMFLVIQGIEYLLILTPDWPLNILSYLYGMNPDRPDPGGFAICMAFYLALAFLPALIVPKEIEELLMKRTLAYNRYPLVICALGLLLGGSAQSVPAAPDPADTWTAAYLTAREERS